MLLIYTNNLIFQNLTIEILEILLIIPINIVKGKQSFYHQIKTYLKNLKNLKSINTRKIDKFNNDFNKIR